MAAGAAARREAPGRQRAGAGLAGGERLCDDSTHRGGRFNLCTNQPTNFLKLLAEETHAIHLRGETFIPGSKGNLSLLEICVYIYIYIYFFFPGVLSKQKETTGLSNSCDSPSGRLTIGLSDSLTH